MLFIRWEIAVESRGVWSWFWQTAVQHWTAFVSCCFSVICSQKPYSTAGHLGFFTAYSPLEQTVSSFFAMLFPFSLMYHSFQLSNCDTHLSSLRLVIHQRTTQSSPWVVFGFCPICLCFWNWKLTVCSDLSKPYTLRSSWVFLASDSDP